MLTGGFMFKQWSIGHRGLASLAALMLIVGLSASVVRIVKKYQTPGPPDGINEGYCDHHNGIYFPSLAFINGDSPYGSRYVEEYPVARQIPFFSPAVLALHAPLAMLPLRVAEVLYFVIMVALIIAISIQSIIAAGLQKRLDWVLLVAVGIVFSRAGHVTLFNGYFTFELVLATILAIRFGRSRPWLAAFALVVVSVKPTYILPLGLLLLARGNFKSLVIGAVFSILAAAIPMAWLAYNEGDGDSWKGLSEIRQQIAEAQKVHRNEPNEVPALSWTRIDILAIYSKWTNGDPNDLIHLMVMMGVLLIPMSILYHSQRQGFDDGVAGGIGTIVMTAMIVGLYRQSYDALLLVPPIVGVLAAKQDFWRQLNLGWRVLLLLMMVFPAYNYLSTNMILGQIALSEVMMKSATSVNALAMVVVLACNCRLFGRYLADRADSSDLSKNTLA